MHRIALLAFASLLLACPSASPDDDDSAAVGDPWDDGCAVDEAELRTIDVGEVSLNVACRGAGEQTIMLMHGFPEFWFGWDRVMDELAGEYRLIAPDLRGYNLSDKPFFVEDYALDHLLADVQGLLDAFGPVTLVGHDWGGALSWAAASDLSGIDRLVIMNGPHLNILKDLLENDQEQQDAFSYVDLFLTEGFEDVMVGNDFALLVETMGEALTDEEIAIYKEAWGQKRAIEGGLNYYRGNFEDGIPSIERQLTVDIPTLVMWGMDDDALLPKNMEGLEDYVSDLTKQEVEGAGHWIAHDVPDVVADAIRGFVE